MVDDLTGTKLGRAKSGTFRTADVVGLDTMGARDQDDAGHTLQRRSVLPRIYATPAVLKALVDKGALGQKAGAGFYKKVGKDIRCSIRRRRTTSTAAARPTI